jgi:hypothetical protein
MGSYLWSAAHTPLIHRVFTASTVLQALQSDRGVVEGTTLRATGTTPPAITFTGTRVGRPCPITIKCPTTGGARGTWIGKVYYDGGTNAAETFTSAATVALTGRGYGLVLNIPTGNAATDNVWKATIGTWQDQSGHGKNFGQSTASAQLAITVGLNGRPGFSSDGISQTMFDASTYAAPGTTTLFVWSLFRTLTWTNNAVCWAVGSSFRLQMGTTTPSCFSYAGTVGSNNTGAAVGSWVRSEQLYNNSSDYSKLGATSVTSASGNTGGSTTYIASVGGATNFAAIEILARICLNAAPSAAQLAAASALAQRIYGSSIGI